MRIPGVILEHPVEGLIAGLLLLALVFGSGDHHAAMVDQSRSGHPMAAAGTM